MRLIEDAKTVYVRIETKRAIYGDLIIYPQSERSDVVLEDFGRRSTINGLLIFRLLLVLTLSLFIIKDMPFRAYSFFILIKTFGYWGLINVMGLSFASNPETILKINFLFYSLTPIGTLGFSLIILPFYGLPKLAKPLLYALLTIDIVVHIAVQFSYTSYFLLIGTGLIVISGVVIFGLFGLAIYKKLPIQKYYSIPFLLGFTGYFLMNLRILLQTEIPGVTNITFFSFLAEILVFILFLGKIFRDSQNNKFRVEQELLFNKEHALKLEEIDELKTSFFTNISHELKTPLTLIASPLDGLLKKYPEDKLLKLMKPSVARLRQLINQILEIQKIEAGKQSISITKDDLAKHLRLHVNSFESLAEAKGIELWFSQNKDEQMAFFDEDKINKIVGNLISNGIKYTQKGGLVEVKSMYSSNPEKLELSVKDNGMGISQEDLPNIFDRFYQVNNDAHQGSGIGLALVKDLVEILRGSIQVESKLKKGTRFSVSIPIDENTWIQHVKEEVNKPHLVIPEESKEVDEFQNERDDSKELLLLVEDNPDMQEYLKILLEADYNILQAYNGDEGIKKAAEEVPDLILTDLMMPVMDGFAFARRIKENIASSHVPIVMLTAKSSKESKMEGLEIGIDQYLNKPFDADELKGIIKNSLLNRKKIIGSFSHESKPSIETKEQAFVNTVKGFLESNYQNSSLGVNDIAIAMEMSDTQLRRKLKAITSYSSNEFLRKFRLQKAEALLKLKEKTISEIAFEVGFENLSYFSKVFQQEFGASPSEYL